MKIICMIPARLGSQRLKQKNLETINGRTLVELAIIKAIKTDVFDEIWVNSESDVIGKFASNLNVGYHKRPEALANNVATSEDFVYEFLKCHDCDYVIQLHSIAPLLSVDEIISFVNFVKEGIYDAVFSCEDIQIECVFNGRPVNFNFLKKENSQDLEPVKRISWSITAWRKQTFMHAYEKSECATYNGKNGFYTVGKLSSHVIKTREDLKIAELLFKIIE